MYSYAFLCIPMGSIGIPGNLEAGEAYLGSHRNTWGSIGIPGNLEAGQAYLGTGSYSYVFLCIPMGSIGMPGNLEAGEAHLGSHRNRGIYRNTW